MWVQREEWVSGRGCSLSAEMDGSRGAAAAMVAEELDGEEGWEVVAGCGAESRMEEKKQAVLELLREDALSFLPNQPSTRDTLCRALTMASRHVVTVQPGFSVSPQSSTWHTGLLDCMSDCSVCE